MIILLLFFLELGLSHTQLTDLAQQEQSSGLINFFIVKFRDLIFFYL